MLQSIPCSPECNIVRQIQVDRPLSYALTTTVDVHVVYLQKFWRTVSKSTLRTIEIFMNKVSYQGVVDKVSVFYTNNLAQPWQTMLKVFNCCLTTRTSRYDQTKINILQLFHAVINCTNVDYGALLWWDFMNSVKKKQAIQYPRFIKLIIFDLMKTLLEIPKQIKEDYHSIKDDIPLVSVYTTRDVRVLGMLILDAFLTKEIHATEDFKEYETMYMTITIRQQKVVKGNKDDDDSKDRLELGSYKDKPEYVDDDDEEGVEKVVKEERGEMGSLEIRIEKM
nr:hypothetical protein [Tanacetum cinerariifolium]